MPITLLDPKNDYVFKRLFADAPALLADLISVVRHDSLPVREVQVLNPCIEPADLHVNASAPCTMKSACSTARGTRAEWKAAPSNYPGNCNASSARCQMPSHCDCSTPAKPLWSAGPRKCCSPTYWPPSLETISNRAGSLDPVFGG